MIYAPPPLRISRLRFELRPRTALTLAPERRGEILYGAFGTILRRTACDPACSGADSCTQRHDCAYAQIFEPAAPVDARFGANEGRKAFLFRPPLDVNPLFGPLRPLIFELRLFGDAIHTSAIFIDASAASAHRAWLTALSISSPFSPSTGKAPRRTSSSKKGRSPTRPH
jgi:hypothetical protein